MSVSSLPIAIIGAGPVGLAAAAHVLTKGETPLVLEAGETVGASIRAWGHVRLFSPWRATIDQAAAALLATTDWRAPDPEQLPTGRELVEQYLEPLAALPQLRPHLRLRTRVLAVTRQGADKMKGAGREESPFLLHVRAADGTEELLLARAVIDASGTYDTPNPLGSSGLPAIGERALAGHIFYGIPDVLDTHRARYAGRRVLVVGSGHSAFNALLDLATLAEQASGTIVTWAVRRTDLRGLFGGGAADALPARGALGSRLRALVESGVVRLVTGLRITRLTRTPDGVVITGDDQILPPVDEIIATTGFRPDLAPLGEVRLALDPALESPTALAPLIDPTIHSCGTVRPHGEAELRHPEPGFYLAGMKSYGRAPTFLLLTGYEQVRSIVCALTGDWEGAREVRLELPETGVCSGDAAAGDGAVCCGAPPAAPPLIRDLATAVPVLQGVSDRAAGPVSPCCS
jgi:thioredoxin reductase